MRLRVLTLLTPTSTAYKWLFSFRTILPCLSCATWTLGYLVKNLIRKVSCCTLLLQGAVVKCCAVDVSVVVHNSIPTWLRMSHLSAAGEFADSV